MGIRNAAKALIVCENKILLNKNKNTLSDFSYGLPNGAIYYDLPGGGQHPYETLEEAVIRECLEETGYDVKIDRLAAIYEEISMNEKFRSSYEEYAHKVHFAFICHLSSKDIHPVTVKDLDFMNSEWFDLEEVKNINLYPTILHKNVEIILHSKNIVYLGAEFV